jgi:lipopolysaccharide/colanic/teichoic acid biosynthesis glycosyltransferase
MAPTRIWWSGWPCPPLRDEPRDVVKRIFDIAFSAAAVIILLPVGAVIALLIKLDSPGPVLYRGRRIGLNMQPFMILKFRTMVPDADRLGGWSAAHHDPRLTRVGALLRSYKLDELPQFFNVLRGEMSIVGPRPQVEEYTRLYTEREHIVFGVRPGLTDYASIRFINQQELLGDHDVDERYQREIEPLKNRLRIKYVETRTMLVDMRILVLTALALAGLYRMRHEP